MARVHDVAAFILREHGTMTAYKLQKLLYYAQGWSLAWDGVALFGEKIKAYENGPVVGVIFHEHRGRRHVSTIEGGDPAALTDEQQETVRAVLEKYGAKTAEELVEMTHVEAPWLEAWDGDKASDAAKEITVDALRSFFTKLRDVPPAGHGDRGLETRLRSAAAGFVRDP